MPTSSRTLKLGRHLTRRSRTQPTRGGAGGPGAFLLQNASWYVDARAYSGTGDLLDLSPNGLNAQLGSTSGSDTNDPLFLPHTGTDYVYLPGTAGNTIACTAPANTASYAAYPLGGGAPTTGAAAAGAFALQTTGSWLRVDLLNAGATVLASFDASAILSPYSGVTDAYSVAWTINRSATGRKTAVVDRPMFLFGTDDYMEVADNDLLDFNASEAFTVLVALRSQANQLSASYLSKKASFADNLAGWLLRSNQSTATSRTFSVYDGATGAGITAGTSAVAGALDVFTAVRASSGALTVQENGGTAGTSTRNYDMRNASPLRIGNIGSTNYADMEFLGAAIFRRALTDAEIAQVVQEFQ